jgi:hypothetical protein
MTPLEELQADGRLGPEGARLLYRVVRTVVVGHGFPPPGERPAWNGEAVAEVAHEFLADDRTPKRLAHLLVHAVDDDSFRRILQRMVLNFLRDGGRRTEIGRLMLRLRDVLARSDEFVAEGGEGWRLEKQPATPTTVAPAVLAEAAATERHVDVPRWSASARRQAPAADAASLERLCRRVLEAAGGTVALDQLARAIAPRLGLIPAPLVQSADHRDAVDVVAGPQHADAVLDSLRAAEIFAILNRRERLLLAWAGTPVRELRSVIGVGPSQAAELQARLRALLLAELQDDEGYEAVVFHLVDQAKAWARHQEEYQHATGQPDAIERLMNAT